MQFRRNSTFCPICKKNGRSEEEYMSHNIRDNQNNLLCPILLNMICNGCGMNGHLRANCPNRTFFRPTGVPVAAPPPPQLPSLASEESFPSMGKHATDKHATDKHATDKHATDKALTATDKGVTVTDKALTATDKGVTDKALTATDKGVTVTDKALTATDKGVTESISLPSIKGTSSYSKIATKNPIAQLPTKPIVDPKYSGYVTISRSDWKKQSKIDDSHMRNMELQRESQIEPDYFMNNIYGGTMLLTKKQFEKYQDDIDTSRIEIIDDNNSDDDNCGYVDVVDDDDEYEDDDEP